jgi:hypothetical protein
MFAGTGGTTAMGFMCTFSGSAVNACVKVHGPSSLFSLAWLADGAVMLGALPIFPAAVTWLATAMRYMVTFRRAAVNAAWVAVERPLACFQVVVNGFAAFRNRIARVVTYCPKPQMCWIDTGRIIPIGTVMADNLVFWDVSIGQNPRNSMGTALDSAFGTLPVERSIAVFICGSSVEPA